ncbi:MAG: acyl carrier protein [Deferribacteraceae bacterium]|jgi:acyl carrier protein|nr:acyl carrier protein [Deferribacteraceae bacterium]
MSDNVKEFILKYLGKKGSLPVGIDIDTFNYIDTGYIDSMGMVKFLLELEKRFDIEITEADTLNKDFKTVGGLTKLINGRINSEKN